MEVPRDPYPVTANYNLKIASNKNQREKLRDIAQIDPMDMIDYAQKITSSSREIISGSEC